MKTSEHFPRCFFFFFMPFHPQLSRKGKLFECKLCCTFTLSAQRWSQAKKTQRRRKKYFQFLVHKNFFPFSHFFFFSTFSLFLTFFPPCYNKMIYSTHRWFSKLKIEIWKKSFVPWLLPRWLPIFLFCFASGWTADARDWLEMGATWNRFFWQQMWRTFVSGSVSIILSCEHICCRCIQFCLIFFSLSVLFSAAPHPIFKLHSSFRVR